MTDPRQTALAAAPAGAEMPPPGNPLATADQRMVEDLALRILADPTVQANKRRAAQAFRRDPFARTPEGKATLQDSLDQNVFAAVSQIAISDAAHPKVLWTWNAAHDWFGRHVPGSRAAFPNPDNINRLIPVDGASRYAITGKFGPSRPAQVTFQLVDALPGDGSIGNSLAILADADIKTKADGTFTIIVDSAPQGEPGDGFNHLQSSPAARLLIVRDTLSDWSTQTPSWIAVRRIGGPPAPPPLSEAVLTARAAELLQPYVAFWLNWRKNILKLPVNTVAAPEIRDGGWGLVALSRFRIDDDSALVVTLDPLQAKYTAFQLVGPWLGAMDYIHHTGSLNNSQSKPNPDGTCTYVIAAQDPGVFNWLDTGGVHEGFISLRWQVLPHRTPDLASAVRNVALVELAMLDRALPPGTRKITPAERRLQLAERAASYERRLTER